PTTLRPATGITPADSWTPPHPAPRSFPTRRSSDLNQTRKPVRWKPRIGIAEHVNLRHGSVLDGAGEIMNLLPARCCAPGDQDVGDRKSTRLNSSHVSISYAVFCLKKKRLPNGILAH